VTIRIDPEGNETAALHELVDLNGREVLEIGSGDGRLTWRYADGTSHVTAIEPFAGSFARASQRLAEAPTDRIEFRNVSFEAFAAGSDADVFDVTLLSWSLC